MSRCCRSKPLRGCRAKCKRYGQLESAQSEFVRRKLETIEHYQQLSIRDMKKKVRDLTDVMKLKDWFDDQEGQHTDEVSVTLLVSVPPRSYGMASSTAQTFNDGSMSPRMMFECFCDWAVNCDVMLKVNRAILKWDKNELVEPCLEDMLDSNDDYNAAAVRSRPRIKEVFLGKSNKLKELLAMIAMYNERYTFHPSQRNSKTFVNDVLKVLGIRRPGMLSLLEDYTERIKSLRSRNIPKKLDSTAELSDFIRHNLDRVVTNQHDVEYLYFMCVLSHVTGRGKESSTGSEQAEIELCLQNLDSAIMDVQSNLVINEFWSQLQ